MIAQGDYVVKWSASQTAEGHITWENEWDNAGPRSFDFCDRMTEPDRTECKLFQFSFGDPSSGINPMAVTASIGPTSGNPPSGMFAARYRSEWGPSVPPGAGWLELNIDDGHLSCPSPPSVGTCGSSGPPFTATSGGDVSGISQSVPPDPDWSYYNGLPSSVGSHYIAYTIDGNEAFCFSINDPPFVIECRGTAVLNAFLFVNTSATGTPGDPDDNATVQIDTSFYNPLNELTYPVSVEVTYDAVTSPGTTVVTTSSTAGGSIPPNFSVADAIFLNVRFENGEYEGPVRVCGTYPDEDDDGMVDGSGLHECVLSLLHKSSGAAFFDPVTLPSNDPWCPFWDPELTAFVTRARYWSRHAVTGADSFCQNEATAAGLDGTFRAWLSTADYSPRFDWEVVPAHHRFVRPDGALIASSWEDLLSVGTVTNFLENPINQTADGLPIDTAPESAEWTVFVTANEYPPNIGLAGADQRCQSEAASAGLDGTFRAWLSTSDYSPASDWGLGDVGYQHHFVRPDGALIAGSWDELTSMPLQNPILLSGDGTPTIGAVWTGTDSDGTRTGLNCTNWTSLSGGGEVGYSPRTDAEWTTWQQDDCYYNYVPGEPLEARLNRFYCFQQPYAFDPLAHAKVWTGTGSDGRVSPDEDCAGWTSNAGSDQALVGMIGTTASWTEAETLACDSDLYRLYCFEQGDSSWLPACPVWVGNSAGYELQEYSCINAETNEICGLAENLSPFSVLPDVSNRPPAIAALDVARVPEALGQSVTAAGAICDPNLGELLTAEFQWGDGMVDEVTAESETCGQSMTESHVYVEPGVYTVTVTVTDEEGEFDTEVFEYAVIFDPSGGFVTGGGWIDSPEGAYTVDPGLTGKANFGFVSKYKKGANEPTGNTEFQFKVADLNFKSTRYDWLVIAGTKAKFKGGGTINGDGNYGFMLSAVDGDEDTFRIKIWDNADVVVYDNQMGEGDDAATTLGGGSIVVHKPK